MNFKQKSYMIFILAVYIKDIIMYLLLHTHTHIHTHVRTWHNITTDTYVKHIKRTACIYKIYKYKYA